MTATIAAALRAWQFDSLFQFTVFVIIGFAAGWSLAHPRRWCVWTASLAMMGIAGAWLGAELACLSGQVERGGPEQLVAAAIGAGALAYSWRRIQRPARPGASGDIAIHDTHA